MESSSFDAKNVWKSKRLTPLPVQPGGAMAVKLARLHGYWFYRALDEFVSSDMATQLIGRPENHEANRLAYIHAMRTQLRLTEVYGVDEMVITDSGARVNLFQALLSLELMSAFFQRDFLQTLCPESEGVRPLGGGTWPTGFGRPGGRQPKSLSPDLVGP